MRSSWKFTPVENVFQRASTLTNLKTKDSLKSWAKGTRLFSDLLEKNLQVYNGVKFVDVLIKKEMLGAFGGSFVLTKRITSDIHHKTKRNKRGRQKKKNNCNWGTSCSFDSKIYTKSKAFDANFYSHYYAWVVIVLIILFLIFK